MTSISNRFTNTMLTLFLMMFAISPQAMAGSAVPAPIAGALGPWGLVILAVGYAGYRIAKIVQPYVCNFDLG